MHLISFARAVDPQVVLAVVRGLQPEVLAEGVHEAADFYCEETEARNLAISSREHYKLYCDKVIFMRKSALVSAAACRKERNVKDYIRFKKMQSRRGVIALPYKPILNVNIASAVTAHTANRSILKKLLRDPLLKSVAKVAAPLSSLADEIILIGPALLPAKIFDVVEFVKVEPLMDSVIQNR
jgi:hypothetical protein